MTDNPANEKLAHVRGARRVARRRNEDPDSMIEADAACSPQRIAGSPIVLVVGLTSSQMDVYLDPERARAEHLTAMQSTAMATQNLLLTAQAEEGGACCMRASPVCQNDVRFALDRSAEWQPQGLLTLGYPPHPGERTARRPRSGLVHAAGCNG
jgi:coenzyme F420-0:L-glutamate ligase / coenzyme F420-1:gamma-L-glutamate ligase